MSALENRVFEQTANRVDELRLTEGVQQLGQELGKLAVDLKNGDDSQLASVVVGLGLDIVNKADYHRHARHQYRRPLAGLLASIVRSNQDCYVKRPLAIGDSFYYVGRMIEADCPPKTKLHYAYEMEWNPRYTALWAHKSRTLLPERRMQHLKRDGDEFVPFFVGQEAERLAMVISDWTAENTTAK